MAFALGNTSAFGEGVFDTLKKGLQQMQGSKQQQPAQNQARPAAAAPPSSPAKPAAAPAPLPLPTESKAVVDVLGIRLGTMQLDEVRATLGKVTPALEQRDSTIQLMGQLTTGRGLSETKEVPNGKFVGFVEAHTRGYAASMSRGPCGDDRMTKGNCEEIHVHFSGPPDKHTAIQISRFLHFQSGPTVAALAKSLTEKYGEPGYTRNYKNRGVELTYVWAWTAEGTPLAINEQHLCSTTNLYVTDANARFEAARSAMRAGCVAQLHIVVRAANSVVTSMMVHGIDLFTTYRTQGKTYAFVDAAMKGFEKQERDKAGTVSAPKL